MDKFVLQVPKWQGEIVFSREVIIFLGVILLLIVGILFCFWGYKYFRTVLFLGIGVVVCYGSYLLVEPMTANLVVRMFLTVALTFFGVCFVYFFDIIFGYILDKLRIRSALGKRTYLIAAPAGAAILGLTIYYFIWRDAAVALAITLCCLSVGLVFQHHKRKKMIRFRCYNDLLKLSRPEFDEDGLEMISMGAAAALAPVSSVLVTPEENAEPEIAPVFEADAEPEIAPAFEVDTEPEIAAETVTEPAPEMAVEPELVPEVEAMPEMTPEPESELESASVHVPAHVLEPEFEPEPIFVMNAERQALEEIESEFAARSEYDTAFESESEMEEAEPESEAIEEAEMSIPETYEAEEDEVEPLPVPIEISESVKKLLLRKMESDEELLEEAFFVKKVSQQMAQKQGGTKKTTAKPAQKQGSADAREKEDEDIHIEKLSPVYPGRIMISGKDRKSRRKREEGIAKAAAIAVAGLGAFIAGRVSKGGD